MIFIAKLARARKRRGVKIGFGLLMVLLALAVPAVSGCSSADAASVRDDDDDDDDGADGDDDDSEPAARLDASVDAAVRRDSKVPMPDASPGPDDAATPVDAARLDGGREPSVGAGLEGTGLMPLMTSGKPLEADDGKWKYFEFDDALCRDGSKAGITVYRRKSSKKVAVFFEGGGACFDPLTCGANPAKVDDADRAGPKAGVFDFANADNPLKDWSFVYVPYCTGDVFAGTKADGNVDGVGPQKFVGYLNTKVFLQRVAPTFADATDVLVTGVSAGGFGAASNVVQVQRAFPEVKVKLIDDSGPPLASNVLSTCLQSRWRTTWGFEGSMLADCGKACSKQDDFVADYGLYLAKTFQNRLSGLISSAQDGIISGFFGAGTNPIGFGDCSGVALLTPVPGPAFQAGLLAFRKSVSAYKNFGTFYPQDTKHTWIMGDSFYTLTVDGVSLAKWFGDIVNDVGTKHVGP